jgi:hypothetical protein
LIEELSDTINERPGEGGVKKKSSWRESNELQEIVLASSDPDFRGLPILDSLSGSPASHCSTPCTSQVENISHSQKFYGRQEKFKFT